MTRPTLRDLTGKSHLSYSSFDTFQQCGEKYHLAKVHRVPQEQSWWLVGGSAYHTATELLDKGEAGDAQDAWTQGWTSALERVDLTQPLRAGGRASKEWPNKEDDTWWNAHGPGMVEQYQAWREKSGWHILDINGTPLIEWGFTLILDNPIPAEDASPSLVIEGYVDRVYVTDAGEVVIVDLKSGTREPASSTQLGIYHAAVRNLLRIDALEGAYFMARKGDLTQRRSLGHYTDELLAYWLGTFEDAVRSQRFLPHVTSMCATCDVAQHCYAVGGTPPYRLSFQPANAT